MLGKEVLNYIGMYCDLYCEQRSVYHSIVCKLSVLKSTVHLLYLESICVITSVLSVMLSYGLIQVLIG